ncbi:MAG: HAMP domain-containing protein [Zoogloeaceae bacterium]|jgi:nitrogen fixation/metabolism regulation signal transduction histidine kinase|nr:HAMP domain-containing protein [Zoogloeaceae bacterium]
MRRLLAIFGGLGALLGGVLWFLMLASTSADTMAGQYPLILGSNLLLALALLGLVGWQVGRLWRDIRNKIFGARLKLRLMLMFGLVAIIPGILVYGVSVQFVTRSIESWFNVRVEKALEAGLNLGRSSLDYLQSELLQKAQGIARDLAEQSARVKDGNLRAPLSRLREQAAVDSAALFAPNGQLIVSAQRDLTQPLPPLPSSAELKQARASIVPYAIIDDQGEGRLLLRVLMPITPKSFFEQPRVLQLAQSVPENLSVNAEAVQEVYRDYQELQLARKGLTQIYALTLTLTVLVALFAAFALAFVLARRLSAPLSILAEGTQAVAQGDYSQRQAVHSGDELGVLIQSFNQMMRQLDDARRETTRHSSELEAARAYLESILANLSAGVLVFDRHAALRTINEGAVTILGEGVSMLIDKPAAEWSTFPVLGHFIEAHFARADEGEWQGQLEMDNAAGEQMKILLLRGAHLPQMSGGGHVVVFDDVTQLIAAQRSAAWGEVARRLAHEIKNPLTPIQLSAERLQLKLAGHLEGTEKELLTRSTQTIINQVLAMKRMVDDFRDYSRHPAPQLAALDLNALIREVLGLYEHSHARIVPQLAPDLAPVMGDINQLRQVIHNLLRNGEDALENITPAELTISTEAAGAFALLQISDNGEGFPANILPHVFEPYITTKPRGTGLGLPIVKKIVDEHQGSIKISNQPAGGACISIRLPLVKEENHG